MQLSTYILLWHIKEQKAIQPPAQQRCNLDNGVFQHSWNIHTLVHTHTLICANARLMNNKQYYIECVWVILLCVCSHICSSVCSGAAGCVEWPRRGGPVGLPCLRPHWYCCCALGKPSACSQHSVCKCTPEQKHTFATHINSVFIFCSQYLFSFV